MLGLLDRLRGGLIVSCQPVPGGPMDRPDIVAAFALAALAGGAVGLRIEGVENLRAVRKLTTAPIIGLVKREVQDSSVLGHGYETALCAGYAAILITVAASVSRPFCSALI